MIGTQLAAWEGEEFSSPPLSSSTSNGGTTRTLRGRPPQGRRGKALRGNGSDSKLSGSLYRAPIRLSPTCREDGHNTKAQMELTSTTGGKFGYHGRQLESRIHTSA